MISNTTSEIKHILKERIAEMEKKPINTDVKGFMIHVSKAKKEAYIQGLRDAINVIVSVERRS